MDGIAHFLRIARNMHRDLLVAMWNHGNHGWHFSQIKGAFFYKG